MTASGNLLRHGAGWDLSEEAWLIDMFRSDTPPAEMAAALQRKPLAMLGRLVKLKMLANNDWQRGYLLYRSDDVYLTWSQAKNLDS